MDITNYHCIIAVDSYDGSRPEAFYRYITGVFNSDLNIYTSIECFLTFLSQFNITSMYRVHYVHDLSISLLIFFFSTNLILGQMIIVIVVIPSEFPGPKCFSPLARSGISEKTSPQSSRLNFSDGTIDMNLWNELGV